VNMLNLIKKAGVRELIREVCEERWIC